jgi:altronate hydrolase
MLVALGGKVVLGEFPELCGVEQELVDRAADDATADRFLALMRTYDERLAREGAGFDMNPSPGNVRDGLITDAMKSAGAARKGGTSPIVETLDYPEVMRQSGLHLMCTPGHDVESVTALAGAGATLVLFTTGLGTAVGNAVAPVIKVSSNSELPRRMPDVIDVDAGGVLSGEVSLAEMGEKILRVCVEVASGRRKTCADKLGQEDFMPWKRGMSL